MFYLENDTLFLSCLSIIAMRYGFLLKISDSPYSRNIEFVGNDDDEAYDLMTNDIERTLGIYLS